MITTVVDGTLKNGGCDSGSGSTDPRFVELYVDGTIDFSGYDLGYSANGGSYVKKALDAFGTISDQYIYVIASGDETTFDDAFPGKTRITMASTSINGNEAFNITDGSATVLDAFGDPSEVSGSADVSQSWYYGDSYAKRNNFTAANSGTFVSGNWTFGGANALDGATCSTLASTVNIGSFSIASTTWDGSDSTDWGLAANWSNGVPTIGYSVTIPSGQTNEPTIGSTTNAYVNDLTVNSGAILTLSSASSIIVSDQSTGNISYSRTLTTNWHLLSSPVGSQDINTFTVTDVATNAIGTSGSNYGIAPYDNNGSAWVYFTTGTIGAAGNFTAGKGYSALRTSAGDVTFTGTMPTSDVSIAITDGSANEWNLIGNPYPSYIPANSNADATNNFITINTADLNASYQAVYFWNGTSYVTVNHASDSRFIAPGQGFFVNSIASGSTVDFTEAMQSHQSTDVYSKTKTSSWAKIVVNMSDENTNKSTEIKYIPGTTTGLNPGYDAGLFSGASNSFSIYSHLVAESSGIDFSLQALPNDDFENTIIPIGFNASSGKELTFSINHDNLPNDIMVFLEDKIENTIIRLDEVNSNYKITLNSDNNGIGRFYLRTSTTDLSKTLNVEDFNLNNVSIYLSDKRNLRITGVNGKTSGIKLFNILGKRILNKNEISSSSIINVSIPSFIKSGIYIVKLENENGNITKKIFLK